ncbi:MAG TPA: hypothetical protein VKU36_01105 [Candidatus Babeliales bacterium]|nr:hypothetical protein [Candidatus Babeliales bacterium]
MKSAPILSFFIILWHIPISSMSIQRLVPELLINIFKQSLPVIDLRHLQQPTTIKENEDNIALIKKQLPAQAETIMHLRRTNKQFNDTITKNITMLLHLDEDSIDIFLIRSTQANIPYFMKIAFNKQMKNLTNDHQLNEKLALMANPNVTYTPDGYTPLLYATVDDNYNACSFLFENNADIDLPRQIPTIEKYLDNLVYHLTDHVINPIYTAIYKGNQKLLTLFLKKGAECKINVHFPMYLHNTTRSYRNLLTLAASKHNPDILKILLETKGIKYWISDATNSIKSEIFSALVVSTGIYEDPIIEAQYKERKKLCCNLLWQAKKEADILCGKTAS